MKIWAYNALRQEITNREKKHAQFYTGIEKADKLRADSVHVWREITKLYNSGLNALCESGEN